MSGPRVLIVGAGIAGLAAGLALARRGITAEIVDSVDEWRPEGAGMYLPGNAVRALEELGLAEAVEKLGAPVRRQSVYDDRGRLLGSMDVEGIWGPDERCLAIRHADLHEVLRDAAEAVPVRLGTTVTALDGAGPVKVTFSDGSAGEYDLVIGADGVHSKVRDLAFGDHPAGLVGQVCWRFVVDGFPSIENWTLYSGDGVNFLTIGIGQGRVYCYADTTKPIGDEDWRPLFRGFPDPVPALLEHSGQALHAPIEEVAPPVWTAGRVVLIGDAAHATSPSLAQGAAMGLEDALVLAESVADRPLEEALTAYRERRTPRVSTMQAQTHRRDKLRKLPPLARRLSLRLAPAQFFVAPYRELREKP